VVWIYRLLAILQGFKQAAARMNFNLFYSRPFVDVIKAVYDLQEAPVLRQEEVGYVPFLRSNKFLKRKLVFNLPFNFYQTADFLRQHWRDNQWKRVKAYAAKHEINITLTTVGDLGLETGMHSAYNSILDLSNVTDPTEKYSRNLKANLRKEWNKCLKHGVELSFSQDEKDLRAFYDVLAAQYVREHQMVFQPFLLYKLLLASRSAALVVAKERGNLVGGMFLLMDGEVIHYNWGARARVANISIGTLMVDYAIQSAKSQGYASFDFGSSPRSDSHLLSFKTRWGCDTFPVYKYWTTVAPTQVDLNASFLRARKIYSHLPVRVASALMPIVVPWLVS
jgi:hypothetical protein